jgi:oxaloacetate decarboxylase alpha subunit
MAARASGATGLSAAHILQIAPVMDRVGYHALDFTSSTHMGVSVRVNKENPWELIRAMRAAAPNTPLQFITTGFRFISWETSDREFMRLVYRRLVENGVSRFALIDPMHDGAALLDGAQMIAAEGGEVLAGLTYTISAVHDDAFYSDLACAGGLPAREPPVHQRPHRPAHA